MPQQAILSNNLKLNFKSIEGESRNLPDIHQPASAILQTPKAVSQFESNDLKVPIF
jgi:hypothetical protein